MDLHTNDTQLTLEGLRDVLSAPATSTPLTIESLRRALTPPAPALTLEDIREMLAEQSGLHSPKFWTRAFAVLGHNMAANVAIWAAIAGIVIGIAGIGALVE